MTRRLQPCRQYCHRLGMKPALKRSMPSPTRPLSFRSVLEGSTSAITKVALATRAMEVRWAGAVMQAEPVLK